MLSYSWKLILVQKNNLDINITYVAIAAFVGVREWVILFVND